MNDLIVNEPTRQEGRDQANFTREATQLFRQEQLSQNLQLRREQLNQQATDAKQRSEDTNASIEQRRESAREAVQARRELGALVAGNRQPLVQVQDAQGNITYVPRDQAAGLKPPERLTASQQTAIANNNSAIAAIDDAIVSIRANPSSLGKKGIIPDIALQRLDPEGVSTRAKVANIGSLKLHDRTGAVVAVNEAPRLMPFIPGVSDTDANAIKKLVDLKAEYQRNQAAASAVPRTSTGGATGDFSGGGTSGGSTKVIDGVTYINDGKGWKPQ